MAETDQSIQLHNALTWAGPQTVGELSDWMMAVHGHEPQVNRPEAMRQENGVIIYPHAPSIPVSRQLNHSSRESAAQRQTIGRTLTILHRGPETLPAELRKNTVNGKGKVNDKPSNRKINSES